MQSSITGRACRSGRQQAVQAGASDARRQSLHSADAGQQTGATGFLFAEVPKVDLKVFLYWDVVPSEYIDLWVHEPSGEICKWNNRTTKAGGTLFDLYNGDIGRGPQYYALDVAPPGEYGFSVHYYTKQGNQPRRCHVVFVIHEGTNDERREEFTFVLPRQHSEHVVKRIMIEGRAD